MTIAAHLIEVKLMKTFIKWAVEDADCQLDCDFFADWFTQEAIENAPKTPGSNQATCGPYHGAIWKQFQQRNVLTASAKYQCDQR